MKEEAVYYMDKTEFGTIYRKVESDFYTTILISNDGRAVIDKHITANVPSLGLTKKCENNKFYSAYQTALDRLGLTTIGREEPTFQQVIPPVKEVYPTLRDDFAGQAMQGAIASLSELRAIGSVLTKEHIEQLCEESYIVADAMLKVREQ